MILRKNYLILFQNFLTMVQKIFNLQFCQFRGIFKFKILFSNQSRTFALFSLWFSPLNFWNIPFKHLVFSLSNTCSPKLLINSIINPFFKNPLLFYILFSIFLANPCTDLDKFRLNSKICYYLYCFHFIFTVLFYFHCFILFLLFYFYYFILLFYFIFTILFSLFYFIFTVLFSFYFHYLFHHFIINFINSNYFISFLKIQTRASGSWLNFKSTCKLSSQLTILIVNLKRSLNSTWRIDKRHLFWNGMYGSKN